MRRIIAVLLCAVLCVSLLASCGSNDDPAPASGGNDNAPSTSGGSNTGGSTPSATPSNEAGEVAPLPETVTEETVFAEHIEYIVGDAVSIINSHSPAGDGSSHNNACRMIYDSLYYNQPDGTSTPLLATHYETDDYQTWIFHLREDVYFHNGDKFTSKDVIFTWEHALESIGSIAAGNWNYIVEARAIDEYTVEFKTAAPYGNLLFNIGISVTGILNERAIAEDEIEGFWVGTGAYKLVELSPADYMRFERNDNYWGELPITKSQTWTLVPEASSRTIMLQNGTAQLGGVTESDLQLFRDDPDNFGIHTVVANNAMSLMFNLDDPICGDINFRNAVAYGVDREELAIFGMGSIAAPVDVGTIWGYETPFKNPNIQPIMQDIEKAKEFLAESSYNGETIELAIMSSGTRLAEAIQDQLNNIGIDVSINPMDVPTFTVYTSSTDNKAQMLTYFAMMSQNPVDTYRVCFYPLANNNRMRYNNPAVTEMIEQSMSILSEDAQREHYYKMQELVTADLPCIPIYYMVGAMVYANGVGGMVTSASAHYDFRYMYQIIEG